jgi:hypothetical protein
VFLNGYDSPGIESGYGKTIPNPLCFVKLNDHLPGDNLAAIFPVLAKK